jgi:hypothetical protein
MLLKITSPGDMPVADNAIKNAQKFQKDYGNVSTG